MDGMSVEFEQRDIENPVGRAAAGREGEAAGDVGVDVRGQPEITGGGVGQDRGGERLDRRGDGVAMAQDPVPGAVGREEGADRKVRADGVWV